MASAKWFLGVLASVLVSSAAFAQSFDYYGGSGPSGSSDINPDFLSERMSGEVSYRSYDEPMTDAEWNASMAQRDRNNQFVDELLKTPERIRKVSIAPMYRPELTEDQTLFNVDVKIVYATKEGLLHEVILLVDGRHGYLLEQAILKANGQSN